MTTTDDNQDSEAVTDVEVTNTAEAEVQDASKEVNDSSENSTDTEEKAAEKGKTPWYMKEITGLRVSKREMAAKAEAAVEANAQLLAEIAALKAGKTSEGNTNTDENLVPLSEVDKLATVKAKELAEIKAFNDRCNDVYKEGKESFADFDNAIANLQAVGALGDNANKAFLDTVTELPNSHKLLHHLGSNPEEASRISAMAPVKMAIELAKIDSSLSNPKPVSKAPAPIKPLTGTTKSEFDPAADKVDMKEFSSWLYKKLENKSR